MEIDREKERPYDARIKLLDSFDRLSQSPIDDLATLSTLIKLRIGESVGTRAYSPNSLSSTAYYSFTIEELDQGKFASEEFIDINTGRMLEADPKEVDIDTMFILGLMAQFPDKGLQRRFREIAGEAVLLQTKWVTQSGTTYDGTSNDPRLTSFEEQVKMRLGHMYYFDTGFNDWQAVLQELQEGKELSDRSQGFIRVLDHPIRFMIFRSRQLSSIQEDLNIRLGKNFNQLPLDNKAHLIAQNLLRKVLYPPMDQMRFN